MAVRWLPTAVLVLGACPALGQAPVAELPPLLPPPARPAVLGPPSGLDTCAPCQRPGDYVPGHAYLPTANPDCRRGGHFGSDGCGGECDRCRRAWVDGSFLWAHTRDLDTIDREEAFGFRLGVGYWFDETRTFGAQIGWLNVNDPYREILGGPTLVDAPINVCTVDLKLRAELWADDCYRLDGLIGYRYLRHYERLRGGAFRPGLPPALFDLADRNEVHAGELALVGKYQVGLYFAELMTSLSAGQNSQSRRVFGVERDASELSLIPEAAARVGYQIGEGTWLTLGYSFLLATNISRPGFDDTRTFYLHGVEAGLEFRF
jgi:hypothetical protein